MVNQFRTLLLNLPAMDQGDMFEVYVPPLFSTVALSGGAAAVWNAVFPNWSYPRDYRNFIANVLTRLVYGSEYGNYMDKLDRRKTNDLDVQLVESFSPSTKIVNISSATKMETSGFYEAREDVGLYDDAWTLTYLSPTTVKSVRHSDTSESVLTLQFTGDVSNYADLSNGIKVRLVGVTAVPSGLQARVEATAPPHYDLMELLARLKSNPEVLGVFSSNKFQDEMTTFRNLYFLSGRAQDNLVGVLLAYVFHVSEANGLY